jgi:hypothetical protein
MTTEVTTSHGTAGAERPRRGLGRKLLTGEWIIDRTTASQRRVIHYWMTILWFTVGLAVWFVLRNVLWFVGFMSLYAIWITHLAGWAAETPVEDENDHDGA